MAGLGLSGRAKADSKGYCRRRVRAVCLGAAAEYWGWWWWGVGVLRPGRRGGFFGLGSVSGRESLWGTFSGFRLVRCRV